MKITRFFIPVISGLSILILTSCDKLPVDFNQNYAAEFTVLPVTGSDVVLFQKEVICNLDSLFKANNINEGTLESVVLTEAYVRTKDKIKKITGINSVKVLYTPEDSSAILIAEKESISQDSVQVNLSVKSVELKDQMNKTKYIITIKGNVDIKEAMVLVAKLTYKYSVKVKTNL